VTIERDAELAIKARRRFVDRNDIDVRDGNSREILPELCSALEQPAFFWLDGHWSGEETAGEDDPCPLLAELDAISLSPARSSHVVAIDDMRLFGVGHELDPSMKHFPRLYDVLARVEAMGLCTFAADDVVVGVPPARADDFLSSVASHTIRQRTFLFPIWSSIEAEVSKRKAAKARPGPVRRFRRAARSRVSRLRKTSA
jgi:hypothetical protein